MHPVILDGHKVKVGDRLYCMMRGWGTVVIVDSLRLYELSVNFDASEGRDATYNSNGKYCAHYERTLFWDKPVFEIPKPPKRMVKKYKVLYYDDGVIRVSVREYTSLEVFNRDSRYRGFYLIPESETEVMEE